MSESLDRIRLLKAAYMGMGEPAREDLARMCCATDTCIVARRGQPVDRDRTLILEAKREVWLWINAHIEKSVDELAAIYGVAEQQGGDNG